MRAVNNMLDSVRPLVHILRASLENFELSDIAHGHCDVARRSLLLRALLTNFVFKHRPFPGVPKAALAMLPQTEQVVGCIRKRVQSFHFFATNAMTKSHMTNVVACLANLSSDNGILSE